LVKGRLEVQEHLRRDWRAHRLLPDFEIEDVWLLPVELREDDDLVTIRDLLIDALKDRPPTGPTMLLVRARTGLGRLFGWDEPVSHEGLRPGSIRERYARAEGLGADELPTPGGGLFAPVYELDKELLSEIENKTVHAALHLGKVQTRTGSYNVQLTIYVQPKGRLGHVYMGLIKPFRLYIVYPAMLRATGAAWRSATDDAVRPKKKN